MLYFRVSYSSGWGRAKLGSDLMFENRVLTPAQVAGCLQVSEARVLRWLSAGQLRGLRLGDEWRTSTLSVAAFLEARANRPTPGSLATGDNARLYTFLRREG